MRVDISLGICAIVKFIVFRYCSVKGKLLPLHRLNEGIGLVSTHFIFTLSFSLSYIIMFKMEK